MSTSETIKKWCPSYPTMAAYRVKGFSCWATLPVGTEWCPCQLVTNFEEGHVVFIYVTAPFDGGAQAEYISALGGHEPDMPTTGYRAPCNPYEGEFRELLSCSEYESDDCRGIARKEEGEEP